jgi:hypothetical protein
MPVEWWCPFLMPAAASPHDFWQDFLRADDPVLTAAVRRRPPRFPAEKLSELAQAWWEDRLSPDWRPHTRDGNQAILDRLGLTGDFWRLPGS